MIPAVDRLWRLGWRVGGLALAYGVTTLSALAAIFLLRGHAPQTLSFFLGFLLITTLSAGLDPGTSKAALIRQAAGGHTAPVRDIIALSALKGVAGALAIGVIWRLVDPQLPAMLLLFVIPITVAGFTATDYRVNLDFASRHQQALWMKQGGLALGIATAAGVLLADGSFATALLWSSAARLAWNTGFIALTHDALAGPAGVERGPGLTAGVIHLLSDRRWVSVFLLSAVAAISGNLDRVVVLRLLPPTAGADYFLWYEVITKFWLIPYIAAPILFARRLRSGPSDRLLKASVMTSALLGLCLLIILPLGSLVLGPWLPRPFNAVDLPVMLFTLGVVLAAIAQLMAADLQARGQQTRLLAALIAVMAATPLIFGAGAITFGLGGVLAGWLVKSLLELVLYSAILISDRRSRG